MRPALLSFTLLSAGVLPAQNTYYLLQVADGVVTNGSLTTTIVLANLGKTTATVTIAASRDDASPRPLTIPGLGTNSRFSTKLCPGHVVPRHRCFSRRGGCIERSQARGARGAPECSVARRYAAACGKQPRPSSPLFPAKNRRRAFRPDHVPARQRIGEAGGGDAC